MTYAWVGGVGTACAFRGSVDVPVGLRHGGNPGTGNDMCCAWGPRRKHLGTDNSIY